MIEWWKDTNKIDYGAVAKRAYSTTKTVIVKIGNVAQKTKGPITSILLGTFVVIFMLIGIYFALKKEKSQ